MYVNTEMVWLCVVNSFVLCQSASIKRQPAPVPWIKVNQHKRESSELKTENEQFNLLDRVCQTSYPLKRQNCSCMCVSLLHFIKFVIHIPACSRAIRATSGNRAGDGAWAGHGKAPGGLHYPKPGPKRNAAGRGERAPGSAGCARRTACQRHLQVR